MENKTILITGATGGIGKETAKALAKKGHTIIIHGRNLAKTQAVCNEIKTETGNNNIDILLADMLSLADVKKLAIEFKQKYGRLDVLINNAGGIFDKQREISIDGLEKTMHLNLFTPFLLTQLLLDVLLKSSSGRIVNVSSRMHQFGGKYDLTDIQLENKYSPSKAYSLAKLYLIWNTRYLAKELKTKGINNLSVNCLHPGVIATNFAKEGNNGWFINFLFSIPSFFLLKPEQGAETSIYLASSPEVENISGEYFAFKKKKRIMNCFLSSENEKIVWDYCMEIVKAYL